MDWKDIDGTDERLERWKWYRIKTGRMEVVKRGDWKGVNGTE